MKTENLRKLLQLQTDDQPAKNNHHPIDKIKSPKTTKKHILGFSNRTAIL
jgi:hypothetical protein